MAETSVIKPTQTDAETLPTKAVLRLYKPYLPSKLKYFNFKLSNVFTNVSCDTRGCGTLYNTKIARYYLLECFRSSVDDTDPNRKNCHRIYTNDEFHYTMAADPPQRKILSTSKSVNISYIIGNYLNFTFSLNKQFPRAIVTKYFHRLRQLLLQQISAVSQRLTSTSSKNRRTRTFIRFSYKSHVIYLGIFLRCNESCPLPCHYVMSNNRFRCGMHQNELNIRRSQHPIPRSYAFYKKQLKHSMNYEKENHPNNQRRSNRYGINYTVTIKGYRNANAETRDYVMNGKGIPSRLRFPYFKEYKNLTFDAKRSSKQVKRWDRLTRMTLKPDNLTCKPILTTPKSSSSNAVVIKRIHHLPRKCSDFKRNVPLEEVLKKASKRLKNARRRARRRKRKSDITLDDKSQCTRLSREDTLMSDIHILSPPPVSVEDVGIAHLDMTYVISHRDQNILNHPDFFLDRPKPKQINEDFFRPSGPNTQPTRVDELASPKRKIRKACDTNYTLHREIHEHNSKFYLPSPDIHDSESSATSHTMQP